MRILQVYVWWTEPGYTDKLRPLESEGIKNNNHVHPKSNWCDTVRAKLLIQRQYKYAHIGSMPTWTRYAHMDSVRPHRKRTPTWTANAHMQSVYSYRCASFNTSPHTNTPRSETSALSYWSCHHEIYINSLPIANYWGTYDYQLARRREQ